MIEQFLSAYLKAGLLGPPRIVSAPGHSFSDIADKALHIVNLESVHNLPQIVGFDLEPLRSARMSILRGDASVGRAALARQN